MIPQLHSMDRYKTQDPKIRTDSMDVAPNFCSDVNVCSVQSGVTAKTTVSMIKLLCHDGPLLVLLLPLLLVL